MYFYTKLRKLVTTIARFLHDLTVVSLRLYRKSYMYVSFILWTKDESRSLQHTEFYFEIFRHD